MQVQEIKAVFSYENSWPVTLSNLGGGFLI
jgi:hypothetical protein